MSTGPMSVSIGQAAARFGLAPSTLRWWESQGVLPAPSRRNGRRAYTETDLRRIGLAYLCCVTGAMPLDQAAVVTSASRNQDWQEAVQRHADVVAERIERLRRAQAYLLHLLQCPDDDIVRDCPYLDDELRRHVPASRDETRDETAAASGRQCLVCGEPLTQPARGRPRRYCSPACRQRRYRASGGSTWGP